LLKLHHYFLVNYLVLSFLILIFSAGVSYIWLKEMKVNSVKEELLKHVHVVDTLLNSERDIDTLMRTLEEKTAIRFTIVSSLGEVIAESSFDKRIMDNHLQRPEIKAAKKEGIGESIRYSNTINEDMLYLAKVSRLNNELIYIRASYLLVKITEDFLNLWSRIFVIFLLGMVVAIVASFILGKKIGLELNYILDSLYAISNKEYKFVKHAHFLYEFHSLGIYLKKLASKLRQRDKQKRKYDAKLRLKNRQQQEILAALSHEFKNPIAVIQGYAQTLIDDKEMPVKLHDKFLTKIFNNSERLSLILDKLTIVTKMENGTLSIERRDIKIKALLIEVANLLSDRYKNRQVKVIGAERVIDADKTLIEMLFINLIENALKYSDEDIIVEISADKIAVIDKGMGISQENIENITKKFYRVSENVWNNSLGLGLSIVTYILNLHTSRLEIRSVLNEGSTFEVSL
jgi:signal transduction histidine kinase